MSDLKTETLEEMATRLRVLRESRRLTLEGLGEKVGLSKSAISRIETGERLPTLDQLFDLAGALNADADALIAKPERRGRKAGAA